MQGVVQAREGGTGAGAGRLHAGAQGQAGRVLVFVRLCRQPGAGVFRAGRYPAIGRAGGAGAHSRAGRRQAGRAAGEGV